MRRPIRSAPAVLALVAICAGALVAGCGSTAPPTGVAPITTAYSLNSTPWPNGTIGQFGLRIDPALLHLLPASVSGLTVVESPDNEVAAMDDPDLAKSFDAYAAASIGTPDDADWLQIVIGHLKPEAQTADWYPSWRDQYATGACSQADGVASTAVQTIADWQPDVSTCNGGVIVYSLQIDAEHVLSMYDLGPRDLGRQLIQNLP